MTTRDKIKKVLRDSQQDPTYGKRPDMVIDRLEHLFLQELRATSKPYTSAMASRSLLTRTQSTQKSQKKELAGVSSRR